MTGFQGAQPAPVELPLGWALQVAGQAVWPPRQGTDMSVLNDPRVTPRGRDFVVRISHGEYLVEEDDRTTPPTWKAYDADGIQVGYRGIEYQSTDPLSAVPATCTAYGTAEELVGALLACDGLVLA